MNVTILIAAILPAFILLFYIYRRDKYQPEPLRLLLKGFGYGILSTILVFFIPTVFMVSMEPRSIYDSMMTAFFGAALPEETAKLIMLWWLLRKNKYYDEHIDGIVYAVCIGMGFAATENIGYLFKFQDVWQEVAVQRALLAVPGHFGFAVLMGYYYSENHFRGVRGWQQAKVLLVPVIAHGIYDTIAFSSAISDAFSGVLSLLLIYFCYRMHKHGSQLISQHLQNDKSRYMG